MIGFEVKPDARSAFWLKCFDNGLRGVDLYVSDCLIEIVKGCFPEFVERISVPIIRSSGRNHLHFERGIAEQLDWSHFHGWAEEWSKRFLWLGINNHIKDFFDCKMLDEQAMCCCLAGDYTFSPIGNESRTELGAAEYHAKYSAISDQDHDETVAVLLGKLSQMIDFFPVDMRCGTLISSIPRSDLQCNLGSELSQKIASIYHCQCLNPLSNIVKGETKSLLLNQKMAMWHSIYSTAGSININKFDVSGKDIVIVDDLYQSGVTMWAYATFLKRLGARRVWGVACVKSLKDSDNVAA